jgi:lipopolysaccharide biosynthesis protein
MNTLLEQLTFNCAAGPHHEPDSSIDLSQRRLPIRAIAYYLPQFHPIPQNDEWWGKGFTEWTNVTKAIPRFAGHYQPRLPADLGFYDLRQVDVIRQQAKLARRYGIEGFCFHYYWFNRRKLLETPLAVLQANPDVDISFCINWANESWTRRWDGSEAHVLMKQDYSAEADIAFAHELETIVRDPRYIRIDGRPLVMMYRSDVLPDAAATVARWRQHFSWRGLPDPYVVMAQSFGNFDPRPYGMDAAAGFPPHVRKWNGQPLQKQQHLFDESYRGTIFNYEELADKMLSHGPTDFRLFPGVCPQWDNEARKPGQGTCYLGSTPEKYCNWLTRVCADTMATAPPEERLVFINAWNEWAEGAHLEPDRHFGHAYLAATARALQNVTTRAAADGSPLADRPHHGRLDLSLQLRLLLRRVARKAATIADHFSDALRSY